MDWLRVGMVLGKRAAGMHGCGSVVLCRWRDWSMLVDTKHQSLRTYIIYSIHSLKKEKYVKKINYLISWKRVFI